MPKGHDSYMIYVCTLVEIKLQLFLFNYALNFSRFYDFNFYELKFSRHLRGRQT